MNIMKTMLSMFFVYPSLLFSQENPTQFLKDLCRYEVHGIANIDSLKMILTVPCSWTKRKEGNYGYKSDSISLSVVSIIKILKFNDGFKIKDESMVVIKQLLDASKGKSIVSTRSLVLNGNSAIEYVTKKKEDVSNYILHWHNVYYFIKFKNKLIVADYQVSSVNELIITKQISDYFKMFKQLVDKLKISKN